MKRVFTTMLVSMFCFCAFAQLSIWYNGEVVYTRAYSEIDSITFGLAGTTPTTPPADGSTYTPEQTKDYLMDVAKRMINQFNTADQKAVIDLADGMYQKYKEYSWDEVGEYFEERYEVLWESKNYLKGVATGQRAPMATTGAYTFSFAGESAIFEADDVNRMWVYKGKSSDNSMILRCKDDKGVLCEAKVWSEGKETTYSYSWEDKTITAVMPEKVHFTLKQGNTVLASLDSQQELKKNDHIYLSFNAKVANLEWITDIKVHSTNASFAFAFNYGSQKFFSGAANLPVIELIEKEDYQTYEEWAELYADRYDELLKKIGAADGIFDLFGEVQVKANINNFGIAYRDWVSWDKNYDGSFRTKESVKKFCSIINDNSTNGIYYNSDVKQAEVKVITLKDETDDSYYPEPVLYFPADGTSYGFLQYFNRKPFLDLQYMVEDVMNAYIRMSQSLHDEVGDIHFN